MGKSSTIFTASAVTLVLLGVVGVGAFVVSTTPSIPTTATSVEAADSGPKLVLPDSNFVVLPPEDAPPFSDYRPSAPAGTFQVGTGFPQGFPYGVPVQKDAHVRGALWHFEDEEYQFMFAGDGAVFDALLDQYAYAEWKLVSEEEVGGARIVTMTNSVWEARLSTLAPDGRDAAYTVTLKRLSPSAAE